MTAEELIGIRKSWGLTQTAMANQLGLSLRAYQDIENKRAAVKAMLVLAVERLSLVVARERKNPTLIMASVRQDILLFMDELMALGLTFDRSAE